MEKELLALYNDNEWTPELKDSKWKKIDDDCYKYSDPPEITYTIDNKIKKDVKNIITLKSKNYKPAKLDERKIIKIYRIYDDDNNIISYTTMSLLKSVKIMYEKYTEKQESHLNYFKDINNVTIELLECYKMNDINRIKLNEIKNNLAKKYNKNINPILKYLDICEKTYIDKKIKKNKNYYFYEYSSLKDKKVLFYSKQKIIGDNRNNIINDCLKKQKIKYFSGTHKFLNEGKLYGDTNAQLILEKLMVNNQDYSNIFIIYDDELTSNRTVKIKKRIEGYINSELLDDYIDDYSDEEYKNITGICYSVKINNKYFVDITLNRTITTLIKNLFMDKVPTKYKKLSKEIKSSDFDKDVEINFEYVAFKNDDEGKTTLEKTKRKLVRQYKVYDKENGLNQKPFNMFKRSFFSK